MALIPGSICRQASMTRCATSELQEAARCENRILLVGILRIWFHCSRRRVGEDASISPTAPASDIQRRQRGTIDELLERAR